MSTGASRNRAQLQAALSQPGNERCADCGAAHPRWASLNLGIFICMRCASVHRKLGTHISRVKSITLDDWTRDQVRHMRQMGNIQSNQYYTPNPRTAKPTILDENERDIEMEKFIRDKYQFLIFRAGVERAAAESPSRPSNRNIRRPSAGPNLNSTLPPVPRRRTSSLSPPPPLPSRSSIPSTPRDPPALPPSNTEREFARSRAPSSSTDVKHQHLPLLTPTTSAPPTRSLTAPPQQFTAPSTTTTTDAPPVPPVPLFSGMRSSTLADLSSLQQPAQQPIGQTAGNPFPAPAPQFTTNPFNAAPTTAQPTAVPSNVSLGMSAFGPPGNLQPQPSPFQPPLQPQPHLENHPSFAAMGASAFHPTSPAASLGNLAFPAPSAPGTTGAMLPYGMVPPSPMELGAQAFPSGAVSPGVVGTPSMLGQSAFGAPVQSAFGQSPTQPLGPSGSMPHNQGYLPSYFPTQPQPNGAPW